MKINSTSNILAIAATLLASSISSHATIIASEAFGGGSGDINATSADTFDSAITTAGGSATWVARNNFNADGSVEANQTAAAYLTLGSYINDAKGTADGLFELTATLTPTTGSGDWISLGFITNPSIFQSFVSVSGGLGTIIQRINGEIDAFTGPGTGGTGGYNGSVGPSLGQELTVVLDLTTHDNSSDFGTITWYQGTVAGGTLLGSGSLGADYSFDAIGFTVTSNTGGSVDNLTLTQIPEPSAAAFLCGISALLLIAGRRRR